MGGCLADGWQRRRVATAAAGPSLVQPACQADASKGLPRDRSHLFGDRCTRDALRVLEKDDGDVNWRKLLVRVLASQFLSSC